jgi:hypothetical protein
VTRPRRRLLGAFGSLLLAAALAVGSGANYQAASVNAGNLIQAGVVAVTSTSEGTALLRVTALAPGHSSTDTVQITNAGDLPAGLTLRAGALADTPASPALSGRATLKIDDLGDPACSSSCPGTTTVYDGALGGLAQASLGTWPAGAIHRFRFTVALADEGTGAENAYQGARTTLDLSWTAVSA